MKKNVLAKILLIVVIAMLALALVACDGFGGGSGTGGGGSGTGGGSTEKDPCTEHVDEDGDGFCDECEEEMPEDQEVDMVEEVVDIIKNASGLIDTVKSIKADGTASLDLAIGGSVKAGDFDHKLALGLKANADAEDPSALIDVKIDDESYVALGYKAANLYVQQPLNMINTNQTSANGIKMDVSALEDSVKHMVGEGLKGLEYLAESEFLASIDFDDLGASIGGMIADFKDVIAGLLIFEDTANGTTIRIPADKIQGILPMLSTLIGEDFATYTGYFDTIMGYIGVVDPDGKPLTYKLITEKYVPSLAIAVSYANETISGIGLSIAIDNLEFEFALNIDINTLSTEDDVAIAFSGYKAQDLTASLGIDLGVKGLEGVLDLVINTSDAFAQDGNQMAGAKVTINDVEAAKASFNGKTVYLDAINSFAALNANGMGYTGVYQQSLDVSVIALLNGLMGSVAWVDPVSSASYAEDEATASIFDTIYEIAYGLLVSIGLVDDTFEPATGLDTFDKAEPAYVALLVEAFDEYAKFIDDNDKSFSDIFEQLGALYEENKNILLGAVDADGETLTAGVQVTNNAQNSADLADFILAFIDIKLDGENVSTIEELIGAVSSVIDGLWAGVPTEYQDLFNVDFIEKIVGADVQTILSQLYLEAGANKGEGLSGYVAAKTVKDGDVYLKISASIGFADPANDFVSVPEDLTGIANFSDAIADSPVSGHGEYLVTDALFGLLKAVMDYTAE